MLGIDLISLGKGRVLNVIDFQPLNPSIEYSVKYIESLTSIRNKYSDLHGTLSNKFYDDTSFFSKNMLFGRYTDETKIDKVVLPAFQEYLHHYIELMNKAVPDYRLESMAYVKSQQKKYDIYNAVKDPAIGLFDTYFGKSWSESFVNDFLFTLNKID